jgi:hypothetical protein
VKREVEYITAHRRRREQLANRAGEDRRPKTAPYLIPEDSNVYSGIKGKKVNFPYA